MICPCCNALLVINEAEGHIGFLCQKCRGLWLPTPYLASLQHRYAFQAEGLLTQLAGNRSASTQVKHCPSCSQPLASSQMKAIELDWCEKCKGVWFDRHELTKIVTFQHELTPTEQVMWTGADTIQILGYLLELISSP